MSDTAWRDELDALTGVLNHDLRAPLRQVVAFLELARLQPDDPEALVRAEAAARRALVALDALVEHVRLGTRPPVPVDVPLDRVDPHLPPVAVRAAPEALYDALGRLGPPRTVTVEPDLVVLDWPLPRGPLTLDLRRDLDPAPALALRALRAMGADVHVDADALRVALPRVPRAP